MMRELERLPLESFLLVNIHRNTRGHCMKLDKNRIARDFGKYFFNQRIINEWNALPEKAVTNQTVNRFEKEIAPFFNLQRSNFRSQ